MICRSITSDERIDDAPLLMHWLLKMHIDKMIDAVLGPPHGNWPGLSYGQPAAAFIAYSLTERNHFLSPARDWVLARRERLSQALGQPIRDADFTDDRLVSDAAGYSDQALPQAWAARPQQPPRNGDRDPLAVDPRRQMEFVARRNLGQPSEPLQGLYAGNPKRATARPTAERLLKAFDGITLYRLSDGNAAWYEVAPLSALQRRILGLLGIPASVYTRLAEPQLAGP